MDKNVAGLLTAMGAFAVAGPAAAVPVPPHDMASAMSAESYAALLRPIPNAAALLKASAARIVPQAAAEPDYDAPASVQTVQYHDQQPPVVDHHHHHHHHYVHHRHHHRVVVPVPVPVPVDHHHHHHHHHNSSAMLDHRFG